MSTISPDPLWRIIRSIAGRSIVVVISRSLHPSSQMTVRLFAGVCTLASVVGGFLGYGIGYFLFDAVGQPLITFSEDRDALFAGETHAGQHVVELRQPG